MAKFAEYVSAARDKVIAATAKRAAGAAADNGAAAVEAVRQKATDAAAGLRARISRR